LVTNDRKAEARKILQNVARINGKICSLTDEVRFAVVKTKSEIKDLFSPPLRCTTILLWLIWFVCAFFYYGMVLLTVELTKAEDNGMRCYSPVNNTLPLNITDAPCEPIPVERYLDVVITSFAEIPGLLLTILIVDRIGRKMTMVLEFGASGAIIFAFYICLPRTLQTILMFALRGLITGAFQVIYIYTPEVYPTPLRSSGLGICSAVARIGGMITPYVAVVLSRQSITGALVALSIYGVSSVFAAVCSFLLPIETAGRPLQDSLEDVFNEKELGEESELRILSGENRTVLN